MSKSKRTFQPQTAESILEYCFQANAIPFVWKQASPQRVTLLKSRWRRIFVRLSQLITFGNIPFLILGIKFHWKSYLENEMFIQLTLHSLWLTFYVGCIAMQLLFTGHEKEVCYSINEFYKFVSAMEGQFGPSNFKRKKALQDWFVNIAAFYTVSGTFFGMAMFIFFHKEAWYFLYPFSDSLKTEFDRRIWPVVVFTGVECWYELTQWISFIVITFVNSVLLLNVGICLKMLLRASCHCHPSRLSVKRIAQLKLTYSKIQLIVSVYNVCLGVNFWPAFLTANVVSATGTLSALILTLSWGVPFISIFVGAFVVVTISIVVVSSEFTRSVHNDSGRLLGALKSKNLSKEARKTLQSMQSCAVQVSSYFAIERKTVLSMLAVICNSTATILLWGKE